MQTSQMPHVYFKILLFVSFVFLLLFLFVFQSWDLHQAESTLNQLLTCMDGLVTRESGRPVVVIAATNRPEDGCRDDHLHVALDSPVSL